MLASAIIPAAGSGKRFGEKKQFKEINGKPLIYCKFDCGMTEFALTKALENHLSGPSERIEEDK